MSDFKELDDFIATLPIAYTAAFVPQSQSQNAGEREPSLNWRVTLARATPTVTGRATTAKPLTLDYMQGIAHVPHYPHALARKYDYHKALEDAAECGMSRILPGGKIHTWKKVRIPAPLLRDVLYSLVTDAAAIDDYADFEEWAADFGYDTDSRKAEAIYNQCVRYGLKLRRLIGDSNLVKLRELFQDY